MKSNQKSPTPWFTFKQGLTQILKAISGLRSTSFFGILGITSILEKLGLNTLDYKLGNTRSHSKSLVPYFTSNKTVLECLDQLRVKLYLFERVFRPLGASRGNWVKKRNS